MPTARAGLGQCYPRLFETEDALELLRDEVRTARELISPNVCRLFDLIEIEGRELVSMEFVDGENLSSLLRRIGRLPADKALDIAKQVSVRAKDRIRIVKMDAEKKQ